MLKLELNGKRRGFGYGADYQYCDRNRKIINRIRDERQKKIAEFKAFKKREKKAYLAKQSNGSSILKDEDINVKITARGKIRSNRQVY